MLEGDTARQVRQLLRERNLLPIEVEEIAERQETASRKLFPLRRGLGATELAMLSRQLATLVRSGMPLEEALAAVGEQNDRPRVKTVLLGVRSRVMEGHSLADGLGEVADILGGDRVASCRLVHGGDERRTVRSVNMVSWREVH